MAPASHESGGMGVRQPCHLPLKFDALCDNSNIPNNGDQPYSSTQSRNDIDNDNERENPQHEKL
jgi:hypothetical protein